MLKKGVEKTVEKTVEPLPKRHGRRRDFRREMQIEKMVEKTLRTRWKNNPDVCIREARFFQLVFGATICADTLFFPRVFGRATRVAGGFFNAFFLAPAAAPGTSNRVCVYPYVLPVLSGCASWTRAMGLGQTMRWARGRRPSGTLNAQISA